MSARALAFLTALAFAAAGCGGGGGSAGDANDVLSETAANLGEIRSGELVLRIVASAEGEEVGFELDGPFALAEEGALPMAEVEYTRITGERETTATFISTGEQAFVEVEGEVYELPEEQTESLRAAGGGGSGDGDAGLGELDLARWLSNAEVSDGEEVGGDATDRITADLDPVAFANDLLALVESFGATGVPGPLEGRDAEQLDRAVESSTVEVLTGAEDRLLRRLSLTADLSADVPESLREQLGDLPEARFELLLELASPNEPVEVEAPAGAQPLPGS